MIDIRRDHVGSTTLSSKHPERVRVPGVQPWEEQQELRMRGVIIGMVAIAAIATAVPASAEDVYVRGPGVSLGVDTGHRDRVVERRVYRDSHRVVVRGDRAFARGNCRTTIIKTEGMTKKIKKCD
jgi:hypothetical protein